MTEKTLTPEERTALIDSKRMAAAGLRRQAATELATPEENERRKTERKENAERIELLAVAVDGEIAELEGKPHPKKAREG